MSSRRDSDLEPLLEDLERTLGDLRAELESGTRRGPPRPPNVSELLRFTESYTIPTVIAVLEATVRSLELLRQLLRLADPERTLGEGGRDRPSRTLASDVGRDAVEQVTRSLEELRRALTEADLPPDADARSVVEDARALSAEIEQRLEGVSDGRSRGERPAGERARDGRRGRRREPTSGATRGEASPRGVRIDVSDAGGEPTDEEEPETETVDVEAELQSIKDELDTGDEPTSDAGDDAGRGGKDAERGGEDAEPGADETDGDES